MFTKEDRYTGTEVTYSCIGNYLEVPGKNYVLTCDENGDWNSDEFYGKCVLGLTFVKFYFAFVLILITHKWMQ